MASPLRRNTPGAETSQRLGRCVRTLRRGRRIQVGCHAAQAARWLAHGALMTSRGVAASSGWLSSPLEGTRDVAIRGTIPGSSSDRYPNAWAESQTARSSCPCLDPVVSPPGRYASGRAMQRVRVALALRAAGRSVLPLDVSTRSHSPLHPPPAIGAASVPRPRLSPHRLVAQGPSVDEACCAPRGEGRHWGEWGGREGTRGTNHASSCPSALPRERSRCCTANRRVSFFFATGPHEMLRAHALVSGSPRA